MHCLLSIFLALGFLFQNPSNTYYINPEIGSDTFSGTSKTRPWKSLSRANSANLRPGDKILLARGKIFKGSLKLYNVHGTVEDPIKISAYVPGSTSTGNVLPTIDAQGYLNGVLLENSSFIEVSNIIITANAGGLLEEKKGANL